MTSHHDSHTTTDVKPEMLSVVQTGNGIPHNKYDIHALPMYMHTGKTTRVNQQEFCVNERIPSCFLI